MKVANIDSKTARTVSHEPINRTALYKVTKRSDIETRQKIKLSLTGHAEHRWAVYFLSNTTVEIIAHIFMTFQRCN